MARHNEIGKKGEDLARKFLEDKDYKIIDTNYKTQRAEIDIIAYDDEELVFVEVRTKENDRFGTPEDTIDADKLRRLKLNAQSYIHRVGNVGPYRIDAVCIILSPSNSKAPSINHYLSITS